MQQCDSNANTLPTNVLHSSLYALATPVDAHLANNSQARSLHLLDVVCRDATDDAVALNVGPPVTCVQVDEDEALAFGH